MPTIKTTIKSYDLTFFPDNRFNDILQKWTILLLSAINIISIESYKDEF